MEFEIFLDTRSKNSNTISFNENGGFTMNSGFFRKNNLGEYSYVTLLFGKEEGHIAVGFTFSKERTKGTLKISSKGNTAAVKSTSFLKRYEIDPKKFANRYEVHEGQKDGIGHFFFIYLKAKEDNGSKSQ